MLIGCFCIPAIYIKLKLTQLLRRYLCYRNIAIIFFMYGSH